MTENFSKAAIHYDKESAVQKTAAAKLCQLTENLIPNHSRILDLGSGTSAIYKNITSSELLKNKQLDLFALDLSSQMLKIWKQKSIESIIGDGENLPLFTENSSYAPSSPYSASKASSDHLVYVWHRTYGLPVIVTNCSNNYGPYHFPEKLIPLTILNALEGKDLPVYGKGNQIRDWLYVEDHAMALVLVATQGETGETYNIGGHNEKKNIEVVKTICSILDELRPKITPYAEQITFVADRPGHDMRYAIDANKIRKELGWTPKETFESGIRKTVQWYLDNQTWCQHVQDGSYQRMRLGSVK